MPGAPVYLTAQGTGDSGVILNTAPPPVRVPKGFFPGWPNANNNFAPGDIFNPLTALGSAIGNVNPSQVSFPTTNGLVQGLTGVTQGRYYFEYTPTYDIFSSQTGCGVGRLGPTLAAWFNKGGYGTSDNNGGLFIDGGTPNTFDAHLDANTGTGPDIGSAVAGSIIGVAVIVTEDYIPQLFNPQQLQPVPLVCIPCTELLIGPKGFGGFGR
jgi:hypothetical protein